jgi:Tfp pilus assembly protein PilP
VIGRSAVFVIAALAGSAVPPLVRPAIAQAPATKTAPQPAKAGQDAPSQSSAIEPQGYTYDPQGRRDPFVSLLSRGTEERPTGPRPSGIHGLMIGEVTVKGIVRDRTGFIAMIQGPDTKTFIVRSGEKLMDGTVKAITADSVVFSQDVNDPLSMVKQKEVRKTVRSSDGGRG